MAPSSRVSDVICAGNDRNVSAAYVGLPGRWVTNREVSRLSELRVGVVGLGSMGTRHAEAYRRVPGVRLVDGATRDPERRRQAEQAWEIETTDDYRELVGRVDAVTIATPTYLHAEIAEY